MSIDLWLTSQDVMGNRFAKEKNFAKPMDSYEAVVGAFRKWIRTYSGTEPGDPAKAAKVLFDISRMDEPPLRLPPWRLCQAVSEGMLYHEPHGT